MTYFGVIRIAILGKKPAPSSEDGSVCEWGSDLVKSLGQILSGVFHMLWEPDALVTMRSGFQWIIDHPRAIQRNATMT